MHDHHDAPGHDHGPWQGRGAGLGHNRLQAAQWQTPHLPEDAAAPQPPVERDLDLVEASFVEGFSRASDPTSFLRLAGIPFVGVDAAGQRLHLLRVEVEGLTDVGAVSPLLGGAGLRYDPLPARLVSHRRCLGFVYHDGHALVRLDFAAARALRDESAPAQLALAKDR
jgi:hypothetical protein